MAKLRLSNRVSVSWASTIRHICLGVKSMNSWLGQEAEQVPHWMHGPICFRTRSRIDFTCTDRCADAVLDFSIAVPVMTAPP